MDCRFPISGHGLSTFHGMHVRGFPNAFFWPGTIGLYSHLHYSLDEQSVHLAHIMEGLKQRGAQRIEASEAAEQKWVQTIIEKAADSGFPRKMHAGYYNNEGQVNTKPHNTYGGGPIEFFADGEMARQRRLVWSRAALAVLPKGRALRSAS